MTAVFDNYRRYRRYSISGKVLIVRQDTGSPERLTGRINNISQGGMGFYTTALLEKATPVSVELSLGILEGIDILTGRIASVSSQGEDFFTGIAFDNEIPYDRFIEIVGF